MLCFVLSVPAWAVKSIEDILTEEYTDSDVQEYFGEFKSVLYKEYNPGDRLNLDVEGETFQVKQLLGSGEEGYIYEVAPLSNPEASMALKLPRKTFSTEYVRAQQLLQTLEPHPDIIPLKYLQSRFMIMEKADGSLESLSEFAANFDESTKMLLFKRATKEVFDGVEHLFANGVDLGWDISSGNVVYFTKGDQVKFKLIDIGSQSKYAAGTELSEETFEGMQYFIKELAGELTNQCH